MRRIQVSILYGVESYDFQEFCIGVNLRSFRIRIRIRINEIFGVYYNAFHENIRIMKIGCYG